MRIFESILDQIDVADNNISSAEDIVRSSNQKNDGEISPDDYQFLFKIAMHQVQLFMDGEDAFERCRDICSDVLQNSRIIESHSYVKFCSGSNDMLPADGSVWTDYPFLSEDDAPTLKNHLYMCFGVNFRNNMTTVKVFALLNQILNNVKKYIPAQDYIEVIGPDGKGGWDTFGITNTMRTNCCVIGYINMFDAYFKSVKKYNKGEVKTLKISPDNMLQKKLMELNMILFKDRFGSAPYEYMMNLPGINQLLINRIADNLLATRYHRITKWKPDELLDFDVEKFRTNADFDMYWKESYWTLTPLDMQFGNRPFGIESFNSDDVLNEDVWNVISKKFKKVHLKDFVLGVKVTKTDLRIGLIMYAGVIKRPMSNYGYSAVYLCVTQPLGYYLSGDLISFCDMLEECIGLTGDEKKLISDEIKTTKFRNYDGTVEDYCRDWKKGLLPLIPPDPYR